MRVLVAGDRGYIGAILVPFLQAAGHEVSGFDVGLYERCDFGPGPEDIGDRPPRDIRDAEPGELAGYDAVICLAALSNDPLGHLNPAATYSVNLDGTLVLARAAKKAGVERFLFASSCSLYGAAGSGAVAEDADLCPVTPYGETKVMAERELSVLADDAFSPTYLRNATAYGVSPRLRLDIVVNNLTAVATTTGEVRLESDGSPWRPLVHIEDISRAFLAVLEAPRELVHDQAFNVGRAEDNVQVLDIAEQVRHAVPGSKVSFADGAGPDLRSYRVDFSKLTETFPGLNLRWSVRGGIDELVAAYAGRGLTGDDFNSSRFIRLRRIRELLSAGVLDDTLRRTAGGRFPEPDSEITQEEQLCPSLPPGRPHGHAADMVAADAAGADQPWPGTADAPSLVPAAGPADAPSSRSAELRQRLRQSAGRLSWGLADQAVSSLTNAFMSIYVARELGAVQFGAFSIAYVTYSFALNASRGLATDPLVVRFSGAEVPVWRRAVASASGTALTVGFAVGACVLVAGLLLHGTTRLAFIALGVTLPGLLLQDSWRYAFFALGRGRGAFINDSVWALTMLPMLLFLRMSHHADVFTFVLAWGAAANIAAAVGPLQTRILPNPAAVWAWVSRHRDLGLRYLAENTANSGGAQLRIYGVGLMLGLAVVGYVSASSTLMGPFMVVLMGMSLVTVPEAARVLRKSPRHLRLFCLLVGVVLAVAALAWGAVLLVALPRGFGQWLLGPIWRPTYPLVLPVTLSIAGTCFIVGASAGLRALGASRRSLRAQVITSALYLTFGLVGAYYGGAVGTVQGTAIAIWVAALLWWWQLRAAMVESDQVPALSWSLIRRVGRHRRLAADGSLPQPDSGWPGRDPGRPPGAQPPRPGQSKRA
jgi:nucleoside-diphosphate-sugar epimerase/O-antigen/teichoic acid export membrane protein